ncbi:hypothetical protein MJ1HA_2151 [Metallosphaera sedula]|nr:hypothetical protein MJ1HA_2151 [Metallosphaera sedula]
MDRLRLMWLIIVVGNIADVIISWFGWPTELQHTDIYIFDHNVVFNMYINYLFDYGGDSISFFQLLVLLIALKILLIVMIYWFTRLADKLRISHMKWVMLLPFVLITLGVDVYDILSLTSLVLGSL